ALLAGLAASPLAVVADDTPPRDSQSLFDIVSKLEKVGYKPIVDVSYDDGGWEVEAFKDEIALELMVDPASGDVLSEHRDDPDQQPPQKSKLLSEIIAALSDAGYTEISDASFEGRTWEVEARRDGLKRELRVNPETAEVISDRADD
ncbi:MAG: PepSY domain-containing protein, partial [Thermomicrobiales bacterium]